MRIAIIGAGVSGLVAARLLSRRHDVTVYEAGEYAGGHTNTVNVEVAGERHAVDTGFIVFNHRTYPNFTRLLEQQIPAAEGELVAELATTTTTVEQLLSFKPGDFIELDLDPAIQAKVDGVPVLECHYGTSGGRYALKIDRLISSTAQGWLGDHHAA